MAIYVPRQVRTMYGDGKIVKQGIYEVSSTPLAPIGMPLHIGDGRSFRYAKNGSVALAKGKLVQAAAPVANHKNTAVAVAAAVGSFKITVTLGATALTANYYAGGYAHVNDATSEGTIYKIANHPAAASGGNVELTLYDPIHTALDTTSNITLTKHPYDSVIVAPATLTSSVVGVPLVDVDADYYFWAQVCGPCPVLTDGTIVIGAIVAPSGSVAGAVAAAGAATSFQVGTVLQVNADTEYSLINLTISR